jgi:hypothetical protein
MYFFFNNYIRSFSGTLVAGATSIAEIQFAD